jgi:hypothetical protein
MKTVGFREFGEGFEDAPSLVEARGRIPEEERSRIGRYLSAGAVYAVSSGFHDDWFTGEKHVAPLQGKTDGVWLWGAELPYYVLRYGVALPEAFVQRMRELDWKCPVLSGPALRAWLERVAFEMEVQAKLRRKQEKAERVRRALEKK